jgi:hypothetical protein
MMAVIFRKVKRWYKAAPVGLPALVVPASGYLTVAAGAITVVAQAAVENE